MSNDYDFSIKNFSFIFDSQLFRQFDKFSLTDDNSPIVFVFCV
jgi:hypothetical protein